ncbi:insulinase family protein [Alicyclobacillus cycloheptanicus]|uniref:Zn-dependent peptidase n=1 Tax=Alicyclobacillus cycloheptanicus TaxID=1457 RepID=A0ABT9XG56_9BACL|nr:pitrilysin family protein [Alicyclobacillus cycloheptanicus]MDQ0189276.1 putative Zn-dependent peptidase [Alicyclobacillus cycloheptanicus]WDM01358.1 insulinase family protein [Alicyclobacillus cycloheptanicus]
MAYRIQLPNGVRVVGEEIPTIRSVSIGVWIKTGSRYETPRNNGISHFLEHMFFKGTNRYTARELAEVFDGIGGQVNAFTSKEYTCYYAKVLDEHFSIAVDTLADMLFHSRFAVEEMEKEKKVVIEEIRMCEDEPDELVMDVLTENVYGSHPLGYTILGQEENLRRFTQDELHSYIAERYGPENIVVAIAGNVPELVAVSVVEQLFGRDFDHTRRTETVLTPPTFQFQSSFRMKDTEQVHLCMAAPGLPAGHQDLYALVLLNNILGSSPSSKLFQEIREERGLAYSVFSFHSSYQDCGMFGVYAGTSPEHAAEVISVIRETCRKVSETGLTEEELKKAKEQVKGSMMLSLESSSSRMSRLGKNELLLGREITLDESLAQIRAVTTEDVRRVAHDVLGQSFAAAVVGPVDEPTFQGWIA